MIGMEIDIDQGLQPLTLTVILMRSNSFQKEMQDLFRKYLTILPEIEDSKDEQEVFDNFEKVFPLRNLKNVTSVN
jgi:hypothetical protein